MKKLQRTHPSGHADCGKDLHAPAFAHGALASHRLYMKWSYTGGGMSGKG